MKRLMIPALLLLAGCDKDIPADAFVCAGAVAHHAMSFSQDMTVEGIAESGEGYRLIDYRLDPADPTRPGPRRASCKMFFPTDSNGRKYPIVLQISLDADKPMQPANGPGIHQDVLTAQALPIKVPNLGFDTPGYQRIGIFVSTQPRCSDVVDFDKRTATLHSFDAKSGS